MKIHLTTTVGKGSAYEALKEHPYTLLSFAYAQLEGKYVSTFNVVGESDEVKIHLTTGTSQPPPYTALREHPHTLLSFAHKKLEDQYASFFTAPTDEIILDSGAFTAWNAGKAVDLEKYAEWALGFTERHGSKLARIRYVNLDVIPGSVGQSANAEQLKQAAIDSVENANRLRALGVPVSEVFHQDEPIEILHDIVERSNGDLICISPRNDVSVQHREAWLKALTAHCLKRYGKANMPKAHGLAATSERLMHAYPFYSVDSSSWAACLRYGNSKHLSKNLPRSSQEGYELANLYALKASVAHYQQLAETATKLWKKRGIIWND